jgi:hypothetical protein
MSQIFVVLLGALVGGGASYLASWALARASHQRKAAEQLIEILNRALDEANAGEDIRERYQRVRAQLKNAAPWLTAFDDKELLLRAMTAHLALADAERSNNDKDDYFLFAALTEVWAEAATYMAKPRFLRGRRPRARAFPDPDTYRQLVKHDRNGKPVYDDLAGWLNDIAPPPPLPLAPTRGRS